MPSPRLLPLVAMVVLALLASCVDGKGPLGPGPSRTVTLSLQPVITEAAQVGEAPVINRIRVRILQVPGNEVLEEEAFDVDPNADSWPLELEFPVPGEDVQVLLEILLINVTGGVETVEFSGVVGPLAITSGESTEVQQVEVVRGPLDNLAVTSVTVSPASPPALHPEETTQLEAQVVSSDPSLTPVVFWSTLDPGVAAVDGAGLVTAIAPGVAEIVAAAGALADTVEVTVLEPPVDADLAVTKVADRTQALEGDTVLFTVTVTNLGPAGATQVEVRDSLGIGLDFVSGQVTEGSFDGVGGVWVLPTLAVGEVDTLRVRARVSAGAGGTAVTNTAWTTPREGEPDPAPANDTATASVQVEEPSADLALTKTVDQDIVFEGDTVTFTIAITNLGPSATGGVQVQDVLPEGLTLVQALADGGGYDPGTGVWTVGELAVGEPDTLRLRARVDSGTVTLLLTNLATSLGSDLADPDPANDSGAATVLVDQRLADLGVDKDVDQEVAFEGDTVTFTVVLTNAGPQTASGARVFDPVPSGLTFVSASAGVGSYDPVSGTWSLGDVATGAVDTLRLRARVDSGTVGQEIINVAAPFPLGLERDPNPVNDTDSASVFVDQKVADVLVTKTADQPLPLETDTVTFEIVVSNAGPARATGVQVEDALPAGLVLVSHTTTQGTWTPGTGLWDVGDLAAGAADTLKIRVTADRSGAGTTVWNVARSLGLAREFEPDPSNDADSASVTLQGIDLDVTKSVDVTAPDVGDLVTFTVTATNHGPNTATGLVIGDPLPAGLTLVLATPSSGTYASGTGDWSIASLASGASATLTLEATVDAGTGGQTITNTATRTASDQLDTDPDNDAGGATITVTSVDLALDKSVDDLTPDEGQTVTFTVTLTNGGPDGATGITVSDALPAGLTFSSAAPSQGSYAAGTGVWTVGGLSSGSSGTLTLVATVDAGTAGSTLTNTASVASLDQEDPNAANDTASEAVTVTAVDLSVTKSADDSTPDEGQSVTFTVTLANGGPDGATGITVSDALPAGLTFSSAAPSQGSYDSGTGVWTVGSLAAGGSASLVLVGSVDGGTHGQTLTNTATVTTSDQADTNGANNAASVSVTVTAVDLALAKSVDDTTPDEGQAVTFTVTLSNLGPDAASGVSVSDPLPAGLTFSSATPSAGSYSSGTGVWTVGTVAAGGSATLDLVATVDAGTATQTITNTATVSAADQADTSAVNDAASASLTVTAIDLAVSKGASPPTPNVTDTVTYTVTVANAGPDAASGVAIDDALPAGLTFANASGSQGSYSSVTGIWTVGALAAGGSATLTLRATVDAGTGGQTITNTASVGASDQADTAGANDAASASVTVASVDLALAKVVDDATPDEGQAVGFTVTLTNNGPNTATGITVSDPIPAGFTYSDDAPSAGSYSSVSGVWSVPSLASGASATLDLLLLVNSGTATQTLTNTATFTGADQEDTNAANDVASRSVTVNETPADLSYETVGNTELVAGTFAAPATPHATAADGVLATTPTLTVTSTGTFASSKGGTVTLEADGDFSYVPPAGQVLPDTFTYTVNTGTSATVEITFTEMVWYANNTAAAGTGVSNDPFSTLSAAAAASAASQRLYVHEGDGSTTGYGTGVFLDAGEILEGEGVALVAGGQTLFPAGAPPHIRDPGTSPAVTMSSGSTVRGIYIDAPGNDGIRAASVTGGTVDQVTIFQPAGDGLEISSSTGTFTVTALDVEDASGAAVNVSGGDAVVDIDVLPGSLTNSAGRALQVVNTTGGSVTITGGDISDTGGTGVRISGNAGTVSVANALTITNPADTALVIRDNTASVTLDSLDITTTDEIAVYTFNNSAVAPVTLAGTVEATGSTAEANVQFEGGLLDVIFDTLVVDNASGTGGALSIDFTAAASVVEIGYLDVAATGATVVQGTEHGTLRVTDPNSSVVGTGAGAWNTNVSEGGGISALDVVLGTLSSSSATGDGAGISSATGSFSAAAGSITGAAFDGFSVSNGSADVTYGGDITDAGDFAVRATFLSGGTTTFSGAISQTAGGVDGIFLTFNTGATADFTGGLTLSTGTNPGFQATNGGTVNVTGANNTVATTSATGVEITGGTTIGASGVTFRSVSADGGASGILLDGTGTGSFAVTGDGAGAGSGGTIQNTLNPGIRLTDVSNVNLQFMNVTNSDSTGVFANTVSDLTLHQMSITGNGDVAGEHGIHLIEPTGTITLSDDTVTGNFEHNGAVSLSAGTLDLAITGSSYSSSNPTGSGNGFNVDLTGGSTATVTIDGSSFDGNDLNGFEGSSDGTSTLTVDVGNSSTFDMNGGDGIRLVDLASQVDLDIRNSSFGDNGGNGITLNSAASSTAAGGLSGTIDSNTFTDADCCSRGIEMTLLGAAKNILQVTNNSYTFPSSTDGSGFLASQLGSFAGSDAATLDLTLDGNVITYDPAISDTAIQLDAAAASTMCLAFGSLNSIDFAGTTGTGVSGGQFNTSTFNVAGLGTDPFATFIAARLTSTNAGSATEASAAGGSTFTNIASCLTPP